MHTYSELKDKVVLVTGGTQGIGEAMAHEFAAQKVKLAVNGRKLVVGPVTRALIEDFALLVRTEPKAEAAALVKAA